MRYITEYIDTFPDDKEEIKEILSRNSLDIIKTIKDALTQGVEFTDEDYQMFLSLLPYKYSFILSECDRILLSNKKQSSM